MYLFKNSVINSKTFYFGHIR